ncbi:MAG: AbiU2 domain-containing protein [Candidatus Scalindua sp.]
MINTKVDFKNIGLTKTIFSLRQDLDVYELISANLKELCELGGGKSYFFYAKRSAVNSIAIQICKIYEKEKKNKKGAVAYELNSIDGVMKNITNNLSNEIDKKPIDEFIRKYSNSPKELDSRLGLLSVIKEFNIINKEPINSFKTCRDKVIAHSEHGFELKNLPSYAVMEQLFNFAHDFSQTISNSFVGVWLDDMNTNRKVKVALKRILSNHGLKEIKNELSIVNNHITNQQSLKHC